MAEVKVNRNSEQQEGQSQAMERQSGGGEMSRRQDFFPSLFRHPSELFSMNPFAMMRRMNQEMDRMFANAWGGAGQGGGALWSPAIEVRQQGDNLTVCAELPGLNKDDVKVEASDEGLVIRGERKQEHEERREGMYRSERSYGSFYRVVPLPDGANVDQARAEFKNGVLEVSIPVPQQQQRSREIPIQESASERRGPGSQSAGQENQTKAG
jgi:HSP20 family protein